MHHSLSLLSERPGGVSCLSGRLSRSHLPRSLSVRLPALYPLLQRLSGRQTEGRSWRGKEGEEEERPQQASETRVSLRVVLQGHAGSY